MLTGLVNLQASSSFYLKWSLLCIHRAITLAWPAAFNECRNMNTLHTHWVPLTRMNHQWPFQWGRILWWPINVHLLSTSGNDHHKAGEGTLSGQKKSGTASIHQWCKHIVWWSTVIRFSVRLKINAEIKDRHFQLCCVHLSFTLSHHCSVAYLCLCTSFFAQSFVNPFFILHSHSPLGAWLSSFHSTIMDCGCLPLHSFCSSQVAPTNLKPCQDV